MNSAKDLGAGFILRAGERTLSGAKGGCNNHNKVVLSAGAKARPYDPARLRRSGGRTVGRAKTVTTCPAF